MTPPKISLDLCDEIHPHKRAKAAPTIAPQKLCECGQRATIKRAGEWMCQRCREMEHHQQHISAIWKSNGEDTKRKMRATEIEQPEPPKPGRLGILIEGRGRVYAL